MKVADAMSRGIDLVSASESVQVAATRMAELDVGAVFVGTTESVEGVLTDRDILLRVVVEGRHPAETPIGDVMCSTVVNCGPEEDIGQAFITMREKQFRRMPVVDPTGKPVGVITLGDVAKHVEGPEKITEKLREISEPHRSGTPTEEALEAFEVGTDENEEPAPRTLAVGLT